MRRVTINDPTTNRTAPQQPRQRCPEGLESYKAVPLPPAPNRQVQPYDFCPEIVASSSILNTPEGQALGKSPLDFLREHLPNCDSVTQIFSTRRFYHSMEIAEEFHTACDHKPNVLVIIKSGQYIAGGYTEVPFESHDLDLFGKSYLKPNPSLTTYLFSVNKQKVYPLTDPNKALHCTDSNGPNFGHNGLQILNDYTRKTNRERICEPTSGFHSEHTASGEIFGHNTFVVDAYEVYRLE